MTYPNQGHDEEQENSWLKSLLRGASNSGSECPPAETLAAFSSGTLPHARNEEVSRHVAVCGYCEAILARIQEAEAQDTVELPPGLLDQGQERLSWRLAHSMVESTLPAAIVAAGPQQKKWWGWIWNPAPAYGLACAFAVGLLLTSRSGDVRRVEPVPPGGSLRGVVLDLTRGEAAPARVDPASSQFFLSFQIPVKEGFSYQASILDVAGKEMAQAHEIRSFDGIGSFVLVYPGSAFASGRYTLRVMETDTAGRPTGRRFEFKFAL